MPSSSRFRLSALLAGAAVIAATVLPALPAAADDAPTPDPVVTSQPTADPTPVATPTDDATPAADPTPDATPTADPTPAVTTPAGATVVYGGILNRISNETDDTSKPTLVLSVTGKGYLLVDASGLPQANRGGKINATIAVPAGLTLSSNADTRFTQLANYSTSVAPLKLAATTVQKQTTAQLVTQTPVTNGTHQVYVVLVSPKEKPTKASNQTATEAATLVQHADDYWNAQSSGKIDFNLAGTVPWYKSSYSCKTDAGSTALWNQAASVAKSKLGYVESANTHLVLLFPATTNCGGAIGLGTIGWSVNQGGVLWVVGGNNIAIREATITHELGHNLSLGHADWLDCTSANPTVGKSNAVYNSNTAGSGITGCTVNHYGDLVDVMGYGQDGFTGGSLSSPNAIRSGIWSPSAWVSPPAGTNTYVLNPVGSNTGLRSVVLTDDDGTVYFVEFRNFTGVDDQQYDEQTCYSDACVGDVAGQTGVRVLRMEPSGFDDSGDVHTGWQGIPGYDAYLIGRTVGGVNKVKYGLNEVFWTQGLNNGIKVTVTALTANTATVQIVRPTHTNTNDYVYVESTRYYDFTYRVGDTLTAFLGDDWDAETNTYQWQRSDDASAWTNIASATGADYVLTAADLDKYIRVNVIGSSTGQSNVSNSGVLGVIDTTGSPVQVSEGIYLSNQPGSVVVDNSTGTVQATTSSFPAGTTFTYQWYRGSTAIAGAAGKGQTYTLVAADANQAIKVNVKATIPGYSNIASRTSAARVLTIKTTNTAAALTITGTPMAGQTLTANNGLTYTGAGAALTPTGFSYQWLRSGVAIGGATNSTYDLVSADFGKKITVKVTATKAGWLPNTTTSATGPTISQLGTLVHNANATVTSAALVKTAHALLTDFQTAVMNVPATSISYQWLRDGVAISGATTNKYTLVQAKDYGHVITVRVTYKLTGYTAATQTATEGTGTYSIVANPALPTIVGTPTLTHQLNVAPRTYVDGTTGTTIDPMSLIITRQWYRNGVAVAGAIGPDYLLAAADKGKTITVKMTVKGQPGLLTYDLPSLATSAATPVIGTDLLPGTDTPAPSLFVMPSSTDFATVLGFTIDAGTTTGTTGITSPGGAANTVKYQWLRDGAAIAGATAATYGLTQADRGHLISLRIITSHAAFGTHTYPADTRYTNEHDYTLNTSGAGGIYTIGGNPLVVGTQIDAGVPATLDADNNNVNGVSRTQQYLRGAVKIPVAEGGITAGNVTYTIKAADVGKTLSVTQTLGKIGYIPVITTYGPTAAVGTATLMGTGVAGTVTVNDPATNELIANPPAVTGAGGSPSAAFAYQWLRDGANIAGATTQKYKLTVADRDKDISVRITASLPGYASDANVTAGVDYSITPKAGHVPYDSSNSWTIGTQAVIYHYDTFTTKDGDFTDGTVTFQWLRAGVAIPGATNDNYLIQAADYNKSVSAQVTVKKPGYIPLVLPLTAVVIGKGVTPGVDTVDTAPTAVVQQGPLNGVLTANTNDLYPTLPAPVLTYKWYRGATAISGATAKTYKLVAADFGKTIGVKITVTRTNFVTPVFTLTSGYSDHTIYAGVGLPQITGTAAVGEELAATPSDFYDDAAHTFAASGIDYVFTWYRSGVAIAGATAPFYTLTSADVGKKITVKTTAVGPGRLAASGALSAVTNTVVAGTIDVASYHPVSTLNASTRKATITFAGTANTTGATASYQWYRNGAAISGATASSFTLATTDTGKAITVVVRLAKAGFTTYTFVAAPGQLVNRLAADGDWPVITGGTDTSNGAVGQTLACVAPFYYKADNGAGLGTQLLPGTTPGDTQTVQWTKDGVAIAGQTVYNYTVVAGDSGHSIGCTVTAGAALYKTLVDVAPVALTIS